VGYIAAMVILLAALKPIAQHLSSLEPFDNQAKASIQQVAPSASTNSLHHQDSMSRPSGSQFNQLPVATRLGQPAIAQLKADEFQFETRVDFPASIRTNPAQYAESLTHTNGTLDLTLVHQRNTTNYIFQISSLPQPQCESDATRACQAQAAPAKGNVAEIQIALPAGQLQPGTYPFGDTRAIAANDAILYSRQLYSDPSHGQLGCQTWSRGVLHITRAIYDASGNLTDLAANLIRECHQTAPLPTLPPQDAALHVEVENIERYTYRASWWCRLSNVL
jgi:hypothetical protein